MALAARVGVRSVLRTPAGRSRFALVWTTNEMPLSDANVEM